MMFPYRLYPKRSESGTNRIRANPERIRDNDPLPLANLLKSSAKAYYSSSPNCLRHNRQRPHHFGEGAVLPESQNHHVNRRLAVSGGILGDS